MVWCGVVYQYCVVFCAVRGVGEGSRGRQEGNRGREREEKEKMGPSKTGIDGREIPLTEVE